MKEIILVTSKIISLLYKIALTIFSQGNFISSIDRVTI